MTKRLRRGISREGGYTLTELLIGVALMGLILAAVTQLFQVSMNVSARGNTTEEALAQARTPLTQIVHDLEQSGAALASPTGFYTQATATSLTLAGDVDAIETTLTAAASAGATSLTVASTSGLAIGKTLLVADGAIRENRTITGISGSTVTVNSALSSSYPVGASVRAVESVTYTLSSTTLNRSQDGGAANAMADNLSTFAFVYQDGSTPPVVLSPTTQAVRDQIRQITVQVSGRGTGSQPAIRSFQLIVRPRNLP